MTTQYRGRCYYISLRLKNDATQRRLYMSYAFSESQNLIKKDKTRMLVILLDILKLFSEAAIFIF
jgi:hypothetical protein